MASPSNLKIQLPSNTNIVSTVIGGTIQGILPNFFCNGVPSIVVRSQDPLAVYIMPITGGVLPAKIDVTNFSSSMGTVIYPGYEEGLGVMSIINNFQGNGCTSIMLGGGSTTFAGVFMINGHENFPSIFNVTQMDDDNQYGFVYRVPITGTSGSSGKYSGETSSDIIICQESDTSIGHDSPSECSVIYNSPNPFPPMINSSWVDGVAGYNIIGDTTDNAEFASSILSGDMNGDGLAEFAAYSDQRNITIFYGQPRGTMPAKISVEAIDGKYGFKIYSHNRDISESQDGYLMAMGDFNKDGRKDLVVSAQQLSLQESFCGIVFILNGHDEMGLNDLNLDLLTPPFGSIIVGGNAVTPPITTNDDDYTPPPPSCRNNSYRVAAADVNGDGYDDLLLSLQDCGVWFYCQGFVVFGGPNGIPDGINVSTMTASQGLIFNMTVTGQTLDMSAIGKIAGIAQDYFIISSGSTAGGNHVDTETYIVRLQGANEGFAEEVA